MANDNSNYDRWNELRRQKCGCLIKHRVIVLDSCECFHPDCTCPVTSAWFLSLACSHALGMAKLRCTGVPNDGTLNYCACFTIRDEDKCCQFLCSLLYSLCLLPIILWGIAMAVTVFFLVDFWAFLFWALTCGCCGTPLKFAYANELNSFSENDERVIACKADRSTRSNFSGARTYGEWKNQVYFGRGRPCTCNLCLCFPCYQDLHGRDSTSEDADDGVYKHYFPEFVAVGSDDEKGTTTECFRVDKYKECVA